MKKIKRLSFRSQLDDRYKVAFYISLMVIGCAAAYFVDYGVSALLGCAAGILGHWKATWVSKVEISVASYGGVEKFLCSNGYVFHKEKQCWEVNIHRYLRFDAQDVNVIRDGDGLVVVGPFYIIRKMLFDPAFEWGRDAAERKAN
ncbi:hypothetical protein [Xanthomonas graminis]|uniref:hypothetical protein n=1 Tax=Xanthomonas graminis TaxID=3390026 RepID=UPI0009BE79B9|nr:hypothetical protein [Xanthomonas translucens]